MHQGRSGWAEKLRPSTVIRSRAENLPPTVCDSRTVQPVVSLTLGKDPVPIVQEARWAPGPFWMGGKASPPHRYSIPGGKPPPTCLRFPDRPARSQSYPRERPGTYCTGGQVGTRAVLDGRKSFAPPPVCDSRTVQPVVSRYTY